MKIVIQDIFSKYILIIRKSYLIIINIYHFYLREKSKSIEKLICSIEDKEKYVIDIRVLKQALNHGLVLRKLHRVIQFNQKDWLKPYIDMNTKLRKEARNDFEKDFFKPMINNSENLLAIEMKKTKVKKNKPVYLGMSILDISKTLMYKFRYDYIKPKYDDRSKLCYTDTDSFIIHVITEDFFVDNSDGVERWFDTSNYNENDKRPLPIGKNKKVNGLFKDE